MLMAVYYGLAGRDRIVVKDLVDKRLRWGFVPVA